MRLAADHVRVRVPATSANLGSGFDALGVALALHDIVEVRAVSMSGATATPTTTMTGGAIQVATSWATTSAWTAYSVIDVPTSNVPCTPGGGVTLTCTATLLGNPATLIVN